MIGCPQCGAEVSVPEQEIHPTCPFCGTAFLLDGARAARHLLVPVGCSPRQLRQTVRSHLTRATDAPQAPSVEPELQIFYFPFRRGGDGTMRPAFESHVPQLMEFRVPGSDWKLFREDRIEPGATLLEPDDEGGDDDHAILHYPVARATFRSGEDDVVFWLDASRGRVLAENLGSFHPAAVFLPPSLLARVAGTYFAILLLLPLPWSLGAALVATPFLHRWAMSSFRGAA